MGESKRKSTKQSTLRSKRHTIESPVHYTADASRPATAGKPFNQSSSWALLKPSAQLWFKNSNTCIILLLLPSLLFALGSRLVPEIDPLNGWRILGLISLGIGILLMLFNAPASLYMQVLIIRGETPSAMDCYRGALRHFFRLLGLAALLSALILLGILFFIIPGLIFVRRYALASFYLIDHNLGIRAAMQRSAADSKPVSKYIWSLIGVNAVITVVTFVLFVKIFPPFGGLIASFIISLYTFGPALRYREVALHRPAADLIED